VRLPALSVTTRLLDMLSPRGLEHEGRHLASFKPRSQIVEFRFPEGYDRNLEKAHAETVAAMQARLSTSSYQGTSSTAAGDASGLPKSVDRPSKLGDYQLRVADAKGRGRRRRRRFSSALCLFEQLAAIQGATRSTSP